MLGLTMATNVMMLRALCGQHDPFQDFIHQCKPHPGQLWTAKVIRVMLQGGSQPAAAESTVNHLQDRYSLRCLPQYYGPIVEGLARVAKVVDTEMNAVTDNPLIDAEQQRFLQGGNFLGQYVGMAMDDLRRYLGLLAKHLDVQIAQLVSPEFNHGLPASLKGNTELCYNMGLKGLQITGNSIMPMLTYYGNPLVEHFPTHAEQYNQNINGLSWGAANLAWQSVQLFQQYSAIALIFGVQALDLRSFAENGHYDGRRLVGPLVASLYSAVCDALGVRPGQDAPLIFNDADQSLEGMLDALVADISSGGSAVVAVEPVLNLFDDAGLAC
jgi:phenylalanine ammonia-lyase